MAKAIFSFKYTDKDGNEQVSTPKAMSRRASGMSLEEHFASMQDFKTGDFGLTELENGDWRVEIPSKGVSFTSPNMHQAMHLSINAYWGTVFSKKG